MRRVVILGSTGSIGTQALDVIRRNPERFDVVGLAASGLEGSCSSRCANSSRRSWRCRPPGCCGPAIGDLRLGSRERYAAGDTAIPEIIAGPTAVVDIAGVECDVVVNAFAGAAGLEQTLAALRSGSVVALANKESLIIGGDLVRGVAHADQIVPVDSEHSAIAQCGRRCSQ